MACLESTSGPANSVDVVLRAYNTPFLLDKVQALIDANTGIIHSFIIVTNSCADKPAHLFAEVLGHDPAKIVTDIKLTPYIVDQLIAKNPKYADRIKLVSLTNLEHGWSAGLNAGVQLSRKNEKPSGFIAFVSNEAEVNVSHLQNMLETLIVNPKHSVSYPEYIMAPGTRGGLGYGDMENELARNTCCMCRSSVFVKKSFDCGLDKKGGMEDLHFHLGLHEKSEGEDYPLRIKDTVEIRVRVANESSITTEEKERLKKKWIAETIAVMSILDSTPKWVIESFFLKLLANSSMVLMKLDGLPSSYQEYLSKRTDDAHTLALGSPSLRPVPDVDKFIRHSVSLGDLRALLALNACITHDNMRPGSVPLSGVCDFKRSTSPLVVYGSSLHKKILDESKSRPKKRGALSPVADSPTNDVSDALILVPYSNRSISPPAGSPPPLCDRRLSHASSSSTSVELPLATTAELHL